MVRENGARGTELGALIASLLLIGSVAIVAAPTASADYHWILDEAYDKCEEVANETPKGPRRVECPDGVGNPCHREDVHCDEDYYIQTFCDETGFMGYPCDTSGSQIECAAAAVRQGSADAINSDCVVFINDSACMSWYWGFNVPTGLYWGYSGLKLPTWGAGLDVIPDAVSTAEDAAGDALEIGGNGSSYVIGKGESPPEDPISDIPGDLPVSSDRKTIEGEDLFCFDPGPGIWTSTAKAAGNYQEWYCPPDEDECFTTMTVPYNEEKAQGTIIALG